MKILRVYNHLPGLRPAAYGADSPLVREIRRHYEYSEVIFTPEMSDEERADIIRSYDVLLTMWGSPPVPLSLAEQPGNLRYICNITGGMRDWIAPAHIKSPYLSVTNWGDAPAHGVAEGAFALLMAMLKDLPVHIRSVNENAHSRPENLRSGTLFNARIGVYGMGVIGRKFVEFLRPFHPVIRSFDPYTSDFPEGVTAVGSLDELFSASQIVVIHAGLNDETRMSVTARHLAMLPDGGILINTARGAIIDQQAVEREIASGRLRAGLDVLYPADLPEEDSPLRRSENCILTAHHVSASDWGRNPDELDITALTCLDNLNRFAAGQPLRFIMTPERYRLST